jgi:hypothetical protein
MAVNGMSDDEMRRDRLVEIKKAMRKLIRDKRDILESNTGFEVFKGWAPPPPEFCEMPHCTRHARYIDHCHDTGAFRGWLCPKHNIMLGAVGDNLEELKRNAARMEEYLARDYPHSPDCPD